MGESVRPTRPAWPRSLNVETLWLRIARPSGVRSSRTPATGGKVSTASLGSATGHRGTLGCVRRPGVWMSHRMRGLDGCSHPGRHRAPVGSIFGRNRPEPLAPTSVGALAEPMVTLVGHGGSESWGPASGPGCGCADAHRRRHTQCSRAAALACGLRSAGGCWRRVRSGLRRPVLRTDWLERRKPMGVSGSDGANAPALQRTRSRSKALRMRGGVVAKARPDSDMSEQSAQVDGGHGPSAGVARDIERATGRGDAVRLWTRGRLRRVTAPEGRARRREQSGRPHRLHEAALRHCEPRRPGGRRPVELRLAGRRERSPTASAEGQALSSTVLVTGHERTAGSEPPGQPGGPRTRRDQRTARRVDGFGHRHDASSTSTSVLERPVFVSPGMEIGPTTDTGTACGTGRSGQPCLQPGEPHDRLQGATDLHRVRGASRRSREKRHGRKESRSSKPGPKARSEVAADCRAQARRTACPVRRTPRQAGTTASWDRTRTLDVDGGASLRRTP
jgi:hypothetical protein